MEALKREVLEELDYHVQNPHFLIAQTVRDGDALNTKYVVLNATRTDLAN
jgi:hypothetical protein